MVQSGRDERFLDVPLKYVIFGNLEIGLKSAKISPNHNLGYLIKYPKLPPSKD
jgi:hypothetical protein